jgi:hypothetical protein
MWREEVMIKWYLELREGLREITNTSVNIAGPRTENEKWRFPE